VKRGASDLLAFGPAAVFLAGWQAAAAMPQARFLFSSPVEIAGVIAVRTADGALPWHFVVTAAEAAAGFLIGVPLGIAAGYLLWLSEPAARAAKPFIFALGAVPIFAFAPLVIVWFGIGFPMKVAVAALGVALLTLNQAADGASAVSEKDLRFFRLAGASRLEMLRFAVFPASLDWVLSSARLAVNVSLLGAFIGEFISANSGLGYFMVRAGALYDVPSVFAGGAYLLLLSAVLHLAVAQLSRRRLALIRLIAVPARSRLLNREANRPVGETP
jgi:NitT/TauT family transport system permease protein